MTIVQFKALATAIITIIASIFMALGTNWLIGISLFFSIWAIAGLFELNR